MAKNPHPKGSVAEDSWESGARSASGNYNEYWKPDSEHSDEWWRGYVAVMREHLAAEEKTTYLDGFDAGLEAAQEHAPAPVGGYQVLAIRLLVHYALQGHGKSPKQRIDDCVKEFPETLFLEPSPLHNLAVTAVQKLALVVPKGT